MTTPDPAPGAPDADRVNELIRVGQAVIAEVGQLSQDSGNQFVSLAQRAETNLKLIGRVRRGAWWLAVSLAVDLVLSVVLGLAVSQLHSNQGRINALTARLDTAQTTTRRDTLCPLYGLFLASENPRARAAYPQGPAAYDRAFVVIRQGYAALDCQQFASGPAPSPS